MVSNLSHLPRKDFYLDDFKEIIKVVGETEDELRDGEFVHKETTFNKYSETVRLLTMKVEESLKTRNFRYDRSNAEDIDNGIKQLNTLINKVKTYVTKHPNVDDRNIELASKKFDTISEKVKKLNEKTFEKKATKKEPEEKAKESKKSEVSSPVNSAASTAATTATASSTAALPQETTYDDPKLINDFLSKQPHAYIVRVNDDSTIDVFYRDGETLKETNLSILYASSKVKSSLDSAVFNDFDDFYTQKKLNDDVTASFRTHAKNVQNQQMEKKESAAVSSAAAPVQKTASNESKLMNDFLAQYTDAYLIRYNDTSIDVIFREGEALKQATLTQEAAGKVKSSLDNTVYDNIDAFFAHHNHLQLNGTDVFQDYVKEQAQNQQMEKKESAAAAVSTAASASQSAAEIPPPPPLPEPSESNIKWYLANSLAGNFVRKDVMGEPKVEYYFIDQDQQLKKSTLTFANGKVLSSYDDKEYKSVDAFLKQYALKDDRTKDFFDLFRNSEIPLEVMTSTAPLVTSDKAKQEKLLKLGEGFANLAKHSNLFADFAPTHESEKVIRQRLNENNEKAIYFIQDYDSQPRYGVGEARQVWYKSNGKVQIDYLVQIELKGKTAIFPVTPGASHAGFTENIEHYPTMDAYLKAKGLKS